MVKQFCEDFVKIHLDSTCPRASRVGALIYDSEAGWSHKTLGCLSRSWTKATCLYSILYMSGVPSPSSIDYKHIKHHQNHRLFCTAVRTFYILLHSTFEYLRWEGQPIHAMPDSEFSSFGAGFGRFSPSPQCCDARLKVEWSSCWRALWRKSGQSHGSVEPL